MSKLMDEVQRALRTQGYALKSERQYMSWIRRYVRHYLPKLRAKRVGMACVSL